MRNEKDLVEIKKYTVGPPPKKSYMQVERGRVCVLRVVLHYRQKNNQNNDGLKKKKWVKLVMKFLLGPVAIV